MGFRVSLSATVTSDRRSLWVQPITLREMGKRFRVWSMLGVGVAAATATRASPRQGIGSLTRARFSQFPKGVAGTVVSRGTKVPWSPPMSPRIQWPSARKPCVSSDRSQSCPACAGAGQPLQR